MKVEVTHLFLHYREIARLVWNLGFRAKPELVEWACERSYDEAMARLFEGMILRPLGLSERIQPTFSPGNAVAFSVVTNRSGVELLVDKNPPREPGRLWGNPTIELGQQPYRLRFIAFFDWDQLAAREFRLLEVLIEQMSDRPDVIGRHALIELASCSIWMDRAEEAGETPT